MTLFFLTLGAMLSYVALLNAGSLLGFGPQASVTVHTFLLSLALVAGATTCFYFA